MPIRKELRHFYQGPEWKRVRQRILERADHCCEKCGVPNHVWATRAMSWWMIAPRLWWLKPWKPDQFPEVVWRTGRSVHEGDNFPRSICREVYIVLTIAHINNTPGDNRDENVLALCQYCHLTMDARFHKQTRSARKDQRRPLLQELSA